MKRSGSGVHVFDHWRIFWTQTLNMRAFCTLTITTVVDNSGHFMFSGDLAKLVIAFAGVDRFQWNLVICLQLVVALLVQSLVCRSYENVYCGLLFPWHTVYRNLFVATFNVKTCSCRRRETQFCCCCSWISSMTSLGRHLMSPRLRWPRWVSDLLASKFVTFADKKYPNMENCQMTDDGDNNVISAVEEPVHLWFKLAQTLSR